MLYTLRFFLSSKCSLFYNANLFGSCIIHILYTGCAKTKKKNNSGARGLMTESYGLLNDIFPFPSILDAGYPIFNPHLANVLFDAVLPSVLGSSL